MGSIRGSGSVGQSNKGRARRQHILDQALEVFIEAGYAGFSAREVARQVGISVGNLHYYFPSKEALLSEMLDRVIDQYADQFEALRHAEGSARERFVGLINFLIHDLGSDRTSALFPEIWALANHDPEAAALMDKMYAWERARLGEALDDLAPELDPACRETILLFISASIEGLTMFIGHGKSHTHLTDAMVDLALASYLHLVDNACHQP